MLCESLVAHISLGLVFALFFCSLLYKWRGKMEGIH